MAIPIHKKTTIHLLKLVGNNYKNIVKLICIVFLMLSLFVWSVNAGSYEITFPDGLTIPKMNYVYEHIGIAKNISIEILENGDAEYQAFYNITHFSSGWRECYERDGKSEGCKNITGCSEINSIPLDIPIFPNYNIEKGINVDPDTFIDKNKSGLDKEVPVLHLFFSLPNFTCGESLNFTIKYQMKNFVQNDPNLQLYNIFNIEGFKIPPLSIFKYVNFNEKVTFPYSRKAVENNYYIPYIALPLNGTTYDRTMEVKILQDSPLTLEFYKKINKSDEPLIMSIFFDIMEKPKLQLVQKDILNLQRKKIDREAKITNLYSNRNLRYIEILDENNQKIYEILQKNNYTDYERGKIPYKLLSGDTTTIDLEPVNIEPKSSSLLKIILQYPFDSMEVDNEFIIGNYIKTDSDVPTDFDVYYNLCLEDISSYEINKDESYSELLPTEKLRFKTSYLGILGSGDFFGLSSYIDNPKKAIFVDGQCSNRINLTINVPVSEAKVHNHIVFQRNWSIKWIPFLLFFIPLLSFYLRPFLKNKGIEFAKNKNKYYSTIFFTIFTIFSLSSINFQDLANLDENIFIYSHKGLWIFIILLIYCWKKDKNT